MPLKQLVLYRKFGYNEYPLTNSFFSQCTQCIKGVITLLRMAIDFYGIFQVYKARCDLRQDLPPATSFFLKENSIFDQEAR